MLKIMKLDFMILKKYMLFLILLYTGIMTAYYVSGVNSLRIVFIILPLLPMMFLIKMAHVEDNSGFNMLLHSFPIKRKTIVRTRFLEFFVLISIFTAINIGLARLNSINTDISFYTGFLSYGFVGFCLTFRIIMDKFNIGFIFLFYILIVNFSDKYFGGLFSEISLQVFMGIIILVFLVFEQVSEKIIERKDF